MDLEEEFTWRGRRIAWKAMGAGPAVVFCHGTPWPSAVWAPFAKALAKDYTVYLWDMPGYGASSMEPHHEVDLGLQGEAFTAMLKHWDIRAPHVIAHDYGGAVALRAHLLHSLRFSSLLLVDVVALRPWESPFFALVKAHPEVFAQLPSSVHRGALEAYIAGASYRGLPAEDLAQLANPWCGDEGQAAFYRQIAQADETWTAALEPHLATINIPTHIVWGEDDTWIPVDRAHRLHRAIPGSTLSLISSAGHLIHYDAPVALATEVTQWLTQLGQP